MQKLDRSRDFGTVSPPWQPDNCDRPAHYEQEGRLYDAHDRLIEPGKPAPAGPATAKAIAAEAVQAEDEEVGLSPAQLVAQADTLPYGAFRKQAKVILGETCPSGKVAILAALNAAIEAYNARVAARRGPSPAPTPTKSAGMTWGGLTGEEPAPSAAPLKPGEIDLAAWARGQREYLFAEVRKGIRTKFNKQITGEYERRDAVEFLVEMKVISAAEARKDVYAAGAKRAPQRAEVD